ncbi:MAG: SAM-dependent methyltransferase [Candidatus Aminicenantes bacterium]|jgi:precorrin-4 methylase
MKKMITFLLLLFFLFSPVNAQQSTDSPSERGRFYVIGTGPAGPQMATLQALDTIQRMDGIAASKEHVELFADYLKNKPILFDPWEGLFDYNGRFFRDLSMEEMAEFMKERIRKINKRVGLISRLLGEGKNVGLLDSGNPTLFAPGHWYVEQFNPEDVVIIPGMGSDAAAMAALGKSVIPAHDTLSVLQTSPVYLMSPMMRGLQMFKEIGKYTTMVIYNALGNPEQLFAALSTIYPLNMPCAVVYWAGYPEKQKIIRGTIADMGSRLAKEEEKYMGILLIGRFLEGKPYEAAMSRQKIRKEE